MVGLNPTISIVPFNVNDLNSSIKRQRLSEQMKHKTQLHVICKKMILNTDTYRLKVKGWRKICHANQKKAGIAILILEQTSGQGNLSGIKRIIT